MYFQFATIFDDKVGIRYEPTKSDSPDSEILGEIKLVSS